MSEVRGISKWLRESFFDIPIAYDRRDDFVAAVKKWKASKKYHAKLYTLLRAVRRRLVRKADGDHRHKPFYPYVRVPCDVKEESEHLVMKDRLTDPFFRVLTDREIDVILEIGIESYLELEERERRNHEAEIEATRWSFKISD